MHKPNTRNVKRVDVNAFNKYVLLLEQKLGVSKRELLQCANIQVRKKVLLSSLKRQAVCLPDKYIVRDNCVVGKKIDGRECSLEVDDVHFLKENSVAYAIPDNMLSESTAADVLKEYMSDSEEDDE